MCGSFHRYESLKVEILDEQKLLHCILHAKLSQLSGFSTPQNIGAIPLQPADFHQWVAPGPSRLVRAGRGFTRSKNSVVRLPYQVAKGGFGR